jgi:hypothetical protein
LVVGFAYLVAAFFVQGAFKEALQALFVVAFAIGLHRLAREWPPRIAAPPAVRAVPLAVIAIGSAYTYSFPGLSWLAGAAAVWAAVELWRARGRGRAIEARRLLRLAAPTVAVAFVVLAVAIAPEVGRMANFADFETFNPSGAGLGNLFNRLSPLEALGIWPSGDFRVEPGDGAVPAIVFYLGAALGLAALGVFARRREPLTWALVGISLLALLLSFGYPTPQFKFAYQYLPGVALFRAPSRILLVTSFTLPVLATLGAMAFRGRQAAIAVATMCLIAASGALAFLLQRTGQAWLTAKWYPAPPHLRQLVVWGLICTVSAETGGHDQPPSPLRQRLQEPLGSQDE